MVYDQRWIQSMQEGFQNIIDEDVIQKMIADRYYWDTSNLKAGVFVPEFTVGKYHISLIEGETTLIKVEIQDLSFLEEEKNFLEFLQTLDGEIVNVTPIVKIQKIEVLKINPSLNQQTVAFAHLLSLLLESYIELAVIEESEFKSQPDAFQDFLTTIYCIKGERITEYDGKTYLKCFSASSWLA